MLPHVLLPLLTLLVSTASAAPTDQTNLTRRDGSVNLGFPYGDQKVRGVNLGGWLVLGESSALEWNRSRSVSKRAELDELVLVPLIVIAYFRTVHHSLPVRKPGRERYRRIHFRTESGLQQCRFRSEGPLGYLDHQGGFRADRRCGS